MPCLKGGFRIYSLNIPTHAVISTYIIQEELP